MEIKEALKVLSSHNKWRRGANVPMTNVKDIGIAIDVAIRELRKLIREKNGN